MLTDIFADRYSARPMWNKVEQPEAKLLTQLFRIVAEQLFPYYKWDGNTDDLAKLKWTSIHDRLSMELGVHDLSAKGYSYRTTVQGREHVQTGLWPMNEVCRNFVCAQYDPSVSPDRFMKERISFIELAFRAREQEIIELNGKLPSKIQSEEINALLRSLKIPGDRVKGIRAANGGVNEKFKASVDELNERFRRAGVQLNYHNGFIQVATDAQTEDQIEKAFWDVVADPIWKNVDIDMKEALDRRDANDRDPAFYAARGLESAIKIISDQKGWTHGGEKGAHNYIDNLASTKSGKFIEEWEKDALKAFFTKVRNPLGHGPGSHEMPKMTIQQVNWSVETCMSWVKSLVHRM